MNFDEFLGKTPQAVLDTDTLTPEATAMSQLDFTNTYLQPLIREICELARLKKIPFLGFFATEDGVLEVGSGIPNNQLFLVASGIFTEEIHKLFHESETAQGVLRAMAVAGLKKHQDEIELDLPSLLKYMVEQLGVEDDGESEKEGSN